jgi:hypothetical protein
VPFSDQHRSLAKWLALFVSGSFALFVLWLLSSGAIGPDTTQDQWVGSAMGFWYPPYPAYAFWRVAQGHEASFMPTVSFHQQFPEQQRTAMLVFLAAMSVPMIALGKSALQ